MRLLHHHRLIRTGGTTVSVASRMNLTLLERVIPFLGAGLSEPTRRSTWQRLEQVHLILPVYVLDQSPQGLAHVWLPIIASLLQ